jgi:hypothetical protein
MSLRPDRLARMGRDHDHDEEQKQMHEEMQRIGAEVDALQAEVDALENRFWSRLDGKAHARVRVGQDEWTAHDAGLVRHRTSWVERRESGPIKLVADLFLWHDVEDVQVSIHVENVGGDPLEQWAISIHHPSLIVMGPMHNIRDFAVAVARLAAAHH